MAENGTFQSITMLQFDKKNGIMASLFDETTEKWRPFLTKKRNNNIHFWTKTTKWLKSGVLAWKWYG